MGAICLIVAHDATHILTLYYLKPTAGKIERVKFQSAGNVWGYFCIGPNGGIHEFADSQFGHVFAKSPNREAARKSLVVALKDLEVRGEIRTPVEYLVQLLETDEFKKNAVTTSWLDGLLREKSLHVAQPPHSVVLAAAAFHAFEHVKVSSASISLSYCSVIFGYTDCRPYFRSG